MISKTTILTGGICFLLGTVVPIATSHAQNSPKPIYFNVSLMKAKSDHDPVEFERTKWKPVHDDLVKSGLIKSWSVLAPIFAGERRIESEYMTIIAFDDLNAFQNIDYVTRFKKYWGEDKWQDTVKQTYAIRETESNELWQVVTSTQ